MGEGIRNAKIVSLLKNSENDPTDDELCEVETDKAVYPIQSSFAGMMGEWKTKIGDTVEIGEELGTIVTSTGVCETVCRSGERITRTLLKTRSCDRGPAASGARQASPTPTTNQTVLSPTITRKLIEIIRPTSNGCVVEGVQEARQA